MPERLQGVERIRAEGSRGCQYNHANEKHFPVARSRETRNQKQETDLCCHPERSAREPAAAGEPRAQSRDLGVVLIATPPTSDYYSPSFLSNATICFR